MVLVMWAVAVAATAACVPVGVWWWRDRRALIGNDVAYRTEVVAAVHAGCPTLGQSGMLAPLLAGLAVTGAGAWAVLWLPADWLLLAVTVSGLGFCVVLSILVSHLRNWSGSY